MSALYLIDYLESMGFVFLLEDERIKLRSPANSLTPEISLQLKSAKEDIFNLLKKRQENKFLPLSYGQRALLFEYRLAPTSPAYNVVLSAEIDNKIDLKVFESTFKSLIKKHPMLRTTYGFLDGVPYQDIHADIEFQITEHEVFDWSREKIEAWSLAEADKPFNLYEGPLFKVCLLKNSKDRRETELYFLFCVHHIALDLWSLNLILRDVAELYQQNSQNMAVQYDSKVEYLNYIHWQKKFLVENELKFKNFWNSKLKGQIEFSGLPPSKRPPATRSFQGEFYSSTLNPGLLNKINDLAKIKGVTPYMIALSALFVFIAKLTGNQKVSILTPAAGRNCPSSESTVGYFVNPIPLIVELDKELSFADLCVEVRTLVLDSLEHQDFPLSRIVELIQTKNSSDPFSLFQTLFLWDQEQVDESFDVSMNGISLFKEKLITEQRGAAFNLQIAAISINKTLHISWRYATDLYDRETIISFSKRFEKLIDRLLLNIDVPALSHSLLDPTEADYQQVVYEWNQTDKYYPENQTISQLFEEQVARTPEAIALVYEGEQLTFSEVNRRANQLGRFIRKKYQERALVELKPDTLIALCVPRSVEMIVTILGILKAGGAYVPIDPKYPPERIRYILADTKAAFVLSTPSLAEIFKIESPSVGYLLCDDETISHQSGDNFISPCSSRSLGYVIYTSGTSGKPKGVMIEQKSVLNVVTEMFGVYRLNEKDNRVAAYSSYSFDVSVTEFFATLLQGGILHLLSEQTRTDISLLSSYIKNNKINYIFLPPAVLSILPDENYVSLKGILFAGERCDQKVGEYWANRYSVFNYYGPTEICVYATGGQVSAENVNIIGKPIMNTRAYVCDASIHPVPAGVAGELCIGGAGLARGYLNQPELTQQRFIDNPFASNEDRAKGYIRLYKTGDLVRWLPNGNLEYLGRNDFQIKLRGYRIELGEIENVLSQHPEIQQGIVLARIQEGQQYLTAYYLATAPLSETQLNQFLSRYLPDYMLPNYYIHLTSLPLTVNGKLDREALPSVKLITEVGYIAPRSELEQQLCEIWKELLKVEKIGIYDDFFRKGGNSILAIQAVHRIGQQTNKEISLAELFQYKTVARLAEVLNCRSTQVSQIERQNSSQVQLSFAQERLWFIEQYEGGTSAYHIPALLRLEKEFDRETLKKSLQAIVQRHEVLRSLIVQDDLGIAYQRVLNDPLSIVEEKILENELLNQCEKTIHRPFDLSAEYPLRVVFYQTEVSQYLLLVIHHVAFDGWSIAIFMKELEAYYDFYSKKIPLVLTDLPIQYKDFAVWQRRYLLGPELARQLSYWKTQLAHYVPLTLLTDKRRPAQISYQGAEQVFKIDQNLSQHLRNLAKELGVSLYTVLLTGFYLLLREYTQQDDLIIGTPVANRHYSGTENMIGFFVNSLVLRIKLDEEQSIENTIQHVYEVLRQAQGHQDIPFETLIEYLDVAQDSSRHPLFQVMFGVQNVKQPLTRFKFTPLKDQYQVAKFDITLFIDDSAECLEGCLNYATSLFEAPTIERMIEHYLNVLILITTHPKKLLKAVSCLSSEEARKVISDWNQTEKNYPLDRTIAQLFEEQVERTPNAIAVVCEGESLTYFELNQRANQLARFIRKKYREQTSLDLQPDTLIALCLHRRIEMIIGILGILKAGGAYVPVDPSFPSDRLHYILNDTKAALVLTERTLLENFQNFANSVYLIALDDKNYLDEEEDNLSSQSSRGHLAYVIYTSGTTGKPKGVLIESHSIVNALHLIKNVYRIDLRTKRVAAYTNFVFDMSVAEFFAPLLQGGELHLLSEATKNDIGKLSDYLRARQVHHLFLPPAILAILPKIQYPHLQHIMIGGESCHQPVEFWAKHYTLWNYYGPTEATIYATGTVAHINNMNIIGPLLANMKGYVLNKNFQPVPIGVMGELYLGGEGLARGYLNQPVLTRERFIDNPFATREDLEKGYTRLYKTGDLVRWLPDGNLEYLGRNDFQIKLRGYRIELGEIENVLSQHPEIQQSVVLAQIEEGQPYLAAYYIAANPLSQTELTQFLSSYLPEYMIPSCYIHLLSLPLTTNGKLDRAALPNAKFSLEIKYVAPRNQLEELVCEIWKELLKVEKVGIYDDFFRRGGNSILAIQTVHCIRQQVNKEMSLAELFQYKTVARLCEVLSARSTQVPQIERQNSSQVQLSFAQERLWFIEQYERGSSAYHIPALLRLENEFDRETLKKSLQAIVQRHEVLRSLIVHDDLGIAYQRVLNDPLMIVEEKIAENELLNQCEKTIHRPFDLSAEYPLRVVFYQTEASQYLLLVIHHVAFDGWSIAIFMKELEAYYDFYSKQIPLVLTDLPIQYKDFAAWQRRYLLGPELARQLSYWKTQLTDYESLTLLTDKKRPAQISYQGADRFFKIDKNVSQYLRNLAKEQGVSLYTVLLTGFYLLLREYTQQDDLIIGTPVANRHYPGTENMIGFFVNSLVLRVKLDGEQRIEDTIQQVYEVLRQAQGHQDIPFEKLVEYLDVAQDSTRHPLFQVMFGVQNFKHPLTRFKFAPLKDQYQVAKFDITLFIDDSAESLEGCLNYATSLFEAPTIERLIEHYLNVLTSIQTDLKKQIKTVSYLSPEETRRVVFDWNQTDQVYPENQTIAQLFEKQVERTPDAIALVFEREQLTYRKLNQRANQLARLIRKKYREQTSTELKPDTLIALCLHRSVEMIVAILGILKAGGAYVPIDPYLPFSRRQYILNDTKASLVLTEGLLLENFQNSVNSSNLIALDEKSYLDEELNNLSSQSNYNNLAYVIYTSGTTGAPKGVMIEHRSLVNALYLIKNVYQIDLNTKRVAAYTNFAFDMSVAEFFAPLLQGGELYLLSEATKNDIGKLSDYLLAQQIHHIFLPPAILTILPKVQYPHLQHIMVGGESCNQTIEFWAKHYTLWNYYGPTETTIYATGALAHIDNPNIIGPLLANTKGYVLNKNFQLVPIGVAGELYIGGVGLARGYLNQPALTQERFIDNPFATKEDLAKGYNRLYKTGDLVRWLADGNLEYLGRNDFQIKLRSYRIELSEIENVLSQHPEIQQNVVLVRTQDGQQYLTAYYVANRALSQTELSQFFSNYLPDYMIPSHYIQLESLPLTPNGKLDRAALPTVKLSFEPSYVAPQSLLQEQLCEIWKELLKVEKIGIYDDFFHRGGNSILAMQVIHRIKQQINRDVNIAQLFQYKTIAKLSEVLRFKKDQTDKIIDLNEELHNRTVILHAERKGNFTLPKNILLTGSTGYIGAFLLHDLLVETDSTIYCLIRAENLREAAEKLYANLNKYQIQVKDRSRVIPILGDLEMDNLGIEKDYYNQLCSTIDVIYHNGAYVHHLLPYTALQASNVKGTFEVIEFASLNKLKFIHFISTVGVLPKTGTQIFNEETPIENIQHRAAQGYVASKWVAENLILQAVAAGIPAHIYRIGRAAACSKTGVCNLDDFFYRLIVSCLRIEHYPDLPFNFDVTPVDLISKQIIKIAKADSSPKGVFHLASPKPASLSSIFQFLPGENVKLISLPLWCQMVQDFIEKDQPLPISPYLSLFDQYADAKFSTQLKLNELDHIRCDKTMNYLKSIGEDSQFNNEQYYRKNFAYIESVSCIGVVDEG